LHCQLLPFSFPPHLRSRRVEATARVLANLRVTPATVVLERVKANLPWKSTEVVTLHDHVRNVRFGSKADKLPQAKIRLCPARAAMPANNRFPKGHARGYALGTAHRAPKSKDPACKI
jgi:hypothetical protein